MKLYLRIWGDLACFSRPESKVERMSYPVITPSATRGLLEQILYKPQFRWEVRRIAVKRPIRFISFRRNEVKAVLSTSKPLPISAEDERTQRNTLALRDVEYVIEASITLTPLANKPREGRIEEEDNLNKYAAMFLRRVEKGQCFSQPSFGCREFPAHFEPATEDDMTVHPEINRDADLGLMLYEVFDLDVLAKESPGKVVANPKVTLFRAKLEGGIVKVPAWSDIKAQLGGGR